MDHPAIKRRCEAGFSIIEATLALAALTSMSLLVAQFMETSRKQAFRSEAMNALTATGSNLRAILSDNPNDAIVTLRDPANVITAYGLVARNVFDINGDGCVVHDGTGPPPVACPETVNNANPLIAAALLASVTDYYTAMSQAKAAGKPGLPVNLLKNSNPATAGSDGMPGNILYDRTVATYGVSASGKICGTYPSPSCPFQPDIYVTPDCAITDFTVTNCDTPSWHYTILYKTSCLLAAKMGMTQVGSAPCPQPTSGFDLGTRTQEIYTGKQTYL